MTDGRTPIERLTDAIEGERRDWHLVEVRPDDIAAVLELVAQSSHVCLRCHGAGCAACDWSGVVAPDLGSGI